jgi:hypothetical protein
MVLDYVSIFIQNNNRLGRSLGCPAIPLALTSKIIEIQSKTNRVYLFIIHQSYKGTSKLFLSLDELPVDFVT